MWELHGSGMGEACCIGAVLELHKSCTGAVSVHNVSLGELHVSSVGQWEVLKINIRLVNARPASVWVGQSGSRVGAAWK